MERKVIIDLKSSALNGCYGKQANSPTTHMRNLLVGNVLSFSLFLQTTVFGHSELEIINLYTKAELKMMTRNNILFIRKFTCD